MTFPTPGARPKALYLLSNEQLGRIYGPQERQAIDELVEVLPGHDEGEYHVASDEAMAQVEIIFSGWGGPRLDESYLARVPNLRLFLYGAGSIRNIVTDTFWERGIPICSAWSANGIPVAEFTLAQIILGMKRAWTYARGLRQGEPWKHTLPVPGNRC